MSDWFEMENRVRYCETDAMGVLHHMNYIQYFEMARTEYFRANGGNYRQMEERGLFLVIVDVQCKYKKPAKYDDLLTLRVRVTRMSGAKLEHEYEVLRGAELLATGKTVLACLNRDGEIQRMSNELLYADSSNTDFIE
ncbi:Acyl-CoA thioester hydrolase YbgC [Thalassoglobus neptunius]|uniref:Acyl-CoA thioester hydrolase YbgC n=1 Tax=Thalassoglobus neptunius TaxID=1938619 RepID=A0A5C5X8G5_9PLAN|nr:thioesterase family protein [Thalassoglobus neptunius]TWT58641.1 Acyl-CoA thioester hydrolase YbgC [Thalassoglobus neptunius]